jgi:molybdate transport system ATP-binding protein
MSRLEIDMCIPREHFDVVAEVGVDGVAALTGPSGSGKSSILRAVAGLEPAARGSVLVDGEAWSTAERSMPSELRDIGYLGQSDGLFPHLSASENVAYTLRASGVGKRAARPAAEEALVELGLGEIIGSRPGSISGGQRRRVALARALAPRRAVYLLDEPFAGLDEEAAGTAARYVAAKLLEHDAPALIAGHDVDRLDRICGRVERVERGRLIAAEAVSDSVARRRGRVPAAAPRSTAGTRSDSPGGSR